MRKITIVFCCSSVIVLGLMIMQYSQKVISSNTIYVYNWGDYIEPSLIDKFEEETKYQIVYETFDSNETMYLKVKNNSSPYDVIFPSEYMVEKMIEDDLLLELDKKLLPNFTNIHPYFLNNNFDVDNKYSVPYFWGTVGIAYNSEIYDQLNIEYPTDYSDLWNPALINNVLLVDGAREVVGSSLNSLGYSLNTTNASELEQAKLKLLSLVPNVKGVVGDEIKSLMINNEAAAIVWSGDAKIIQEDNDKIEFITPSSGSNIYLDNIVIPKTATNIEGAHAFINFLIDEQNASINTDYVGYSSPITAVINEPEHIQDKVYYPNAKTMNNLEYYVNLQEEDLKKYNTIFLEFKISL